MQEREKQTPNTDINRRKVDVRITEYTNQLLTSIQEYFTVVNRFWITSSTVFKKEFCKDKSRKN